MWIVPKTHQLYSVFSQGMLASSEDLHLLDSDAGLPLTSRSKAMPLQTCLRKWKADSWIRHLFGQTLKPCQHISFETELMSSLEATPVLVSHKPESAKDLMMTEPFGPTCGRQSELFDQGDASLRTLRATYRLDSPQLLPIWNQMVTEQRGEYSQRLKLARLTNGNGCSSWPTPSVQEAMSNHGYQSGGGRDYPTLTGAVGAAPGRGGAKWPTPIVQDGHPKGYSAPSIHRRKEKGKSISLAMEVKTWPTPRATLQDMGTMEMDRYPGTARKAGKEEAQYHPENGGQLNPHFVEWLQGISKNWTALDGELMDHNDWNGEWEGVPRVTKDCANRVDRLRLLGNGVVPQTAAKAWTVLSERLQHDV